MRSIAAAADRFGGRPSAFGRIPPTGGVGVRTRFLDRGPICEAVEAKAVAGKDDARNRFAIDWEASGEELDGGQTHRSARDSRRVTAMQNTTMGFTVSREARRRRDRQACPAGLARPVREWARGRAPVQGRLESRALRGSTS